MKKLVRPVAAAWEVKELRGQGGAPDEKKRG
jgi:hypothetical protein